MALACSVYSTSPAKPISLESACRFTTGKTTLIVVLVTPRVLVLACVTGVGAVDAPEVAGRANPAAPAMHGHGADHPQQTPSHRRATLPRNDRAAHHTAPAAAEALHSQLPAT